MRTFSACQKWFIFKHCRARLFYSRKFKLLKKLELFGMQKKRVFSSIEKKRPEKKEISRALKA